MCASCLSSKPTQNLKPEMIYHIYHIMFEWDGKGAKTSGSDLKVISKSESGTESNLGQLQTNYQMWNKLQLILNPNSGVKINISCTCSTISCKWKKSFSDYFNCLSSFHSPAKIISVGYKIKWFLYSWGYNKTSLYHNCCVSVSIEVVVGGRAKWVEEREDQDEFSGSLSIHAEYIQKDIVYRFQNNGIHESTK